MYYGKDEYYQRIMDAIRNNTKGDIDESTIEPEVKEIITEIYNRGWRQSRNARVMRGDYL